ncbi:hypothetical protein [Streptomyces huiliensis]|uniref:hypothetical protein n=1 Tax=Streptomyces huiliensis TaxID=2876027 RepID=UPI001CC0C5E1|nr:hypothetical protein [Streptomyces huiliensis]MBZ4323948.1 hypothetical protein [Streptomyces huiliensis]
MAMDPDTGLQGIDPATWEQLARSANELKEEGRPDITADELKQLYVAEAQRVEDKGEEPPAVIERVSGEADKWDPWEVRVIGPLSVYGGIEFSGGSDWTVRAEVGIKLSGKVIWKEGFHLTSKMNSITWEKTFAVVSGKLTVGIYGNDKCLWVSGEACYWWGKWHCAGFNEKIGCFG